MCFWKGLLCFFLFFLTIPFLIRSSLASTDRFSVIYFRPTAGEEDLITTWGTDTYKAREFHFFTQFDYAHYPLQRTNNGARTGGIIDHLFVQHVGGTVGLKDWWQVDLQLPVVWYNRFSAPVIPAPPFSTETDVGDIFLNSRFRLLDHKVHAVGLALVPFLTIPTGNEDHYIADKNPTGGIALAVDRHFFPWLKGGINAGVSARERVQLMDLDVGFQILMSAGLKADISKYFSAKTEVVARTPVTKPFREVVSSPAEALAGVLYHIPKTGFRISAGSGLSLVRGAGAPDYRVFGGLAYTGTFRKKSEGFKRTVYFDFDSTRLTEKNRNVLLEVADKFKKRNKTQRVIATGHTDSVGSRFYNKRLSIQRAQAVKEHLIRHQTIEGLNIVTKGMGETKPVMSNASKEGRSLNRRVELELMGDAKD